MTSPAPVLLDVRDLSVGFGPPEVPASAIVPVTSAVGFSVHAGEAVALVGESGCGKSVTAQSLLRLLPEPPARILSGAVLLDGVDLLGLSPAALRPVRGRKVGFVFQNPMSALNPVVRVGAQITERLRLHGGLDRKAANARAIQLLAEVGIPAPAERARAWPHELSGGMRQRVVIAIALACDPVLLIADEPTTALDVTVQAQVMRLVDTLRTRRGLGVLLITHDLGLVAQHVDRVVVMYAGQVVESAPVAELFAAPQHPYTRGLLRALPGAQLAAPGERLYAIPGTVPAPRDFPSGCRFADRCDRAEPACRAAPVELVAVDAARSVRCLHPVGVAEVAP